LFLSWLLVSGFYAKAQMTGPISLKLRADDVVPTGNEWIALPDIRASDGALGSFNALSMARRGLLQVGGERGAPVIAPYFKANGKVLPFQNPAWTLDGYWIPTARLRMGDLEATLTWCAPPGSRAAFARLTLTNRGQAKVPVSLGVHAAFGSLDRVTYVPVELHGERTVSMAPWVSPGEVFSFITDDTQFAWSLIHPGSEALITQPPLSATPAADAATSAELAPGASAEALFILGAGIEEFSAAHNAKALRETLDREGADAVLKEAAAYCRHRTRTTGQADLDLLMNRNFLFTDFYAWGRTIDTEQRVGVTSRSPRYYVSAAYWDRDALLWSFPALLDSDPALARQALDYALTVQLRNAGTHSRFIDGAVLEDGFQLDEAAAPVIALAAFMRAQPDLAFLRAHADALNKLRDNLLTRYDERTGLYSSLQDSQDEYQKLPFLTYDNVLTWKALDGLHELFAKLGNDKDAGAMAERAKALRTAIMEHSISRDAPGADGPIFASATDGEHSIFTEIPPGALMRLPALGFIAESDPIFVRTYRWLHSKQYKYSYADEPYGLPGSYRVPFTTSWAVADHMQLNEGRAKALKILRASNWDGGIITEGVDPATGQMDQAGRAFATAAGYVAHAICAMACEPATPDR
jgi:hypothetical protein